MTAAAADRSPTTMKRLAAALAFVCLVLLLLAIDQRRTVEAVRDVAGAVRPVAGRLWSWAGDLPSGAAGGWTGFRRALAGDGSDRALAAEPGDAVLVGEFAPADDATRRATGGAVFAGARLRFESGETLRTRPIRIAAGRDAWAADRTFAGRFEAAPDAQIELRRVISLHEPEPVAVSTLCQGGVPAALALLHRGDRVDVMLFREGPVIGPDAPASALCGVWRYRAR